MMFIINAMIYCLIIRCLHCFLVLELGILVSVKVIRLANTGRGEDKIRRDTIQSRMYTTGVFL